MAKYQNFIDSPFNDYQQIDMIVSRDCTLRCTYCYLHKNKDKIYDMDAMLNSLDKILEETEKNLDKPGVVLSFYPEPWVNIQRSNELITKSLERLLKYPKCLANFMIMLGTNGVRLNEPIPVIDQFLDHLSVGVTIDGIKEQHDMYRLFPDGSPSWEIVKKNILDNQEKYRINHTKVTLGPQTIKYIYESSLFLWEEMHFKDINMNVVFEDLWGSEDEKKKSLDEFENQLDMLTSDIIRNKRWNHSQFQSIVGSRQISSIWELKKYPDAPLGLEVIRSFCGAASMRSIDSDGSIYPCFRLSPYSLQDNKTFNISNSEVSRSLKLLNNFDSVPEKCRKCELLSVCPMCVGGAYEEFGSIYSRTTHHCEFQFMQDKYARKIQEAIDEDEKNV